MSKTLKGAPVPVRVWADVAEVESAAFDQLHVAASPPRFFHLVATTPRAVVRLAALVIGFAAILSTIPAVATPFAGTYTVPGDFPTLSAALSALSGNGVSGPVQLELASATYLESVTIPGITGASPANRLTITSASGVGAVLSSDASWVLRIQGAQYVTLDHLTIRPLGASDAAVTFVGSALGVAVKGCVFETAGNSFTNSVVALSVSLTDVLIQDNDLTSDAFGICIQGCFVDSVRLDGNRVYSHFNNGIFLGSLTGPATSRGVLVSNNFVTGSISPCLLIALGPQDLHLEIYHNSINMTMGTAFSVIGAGTGVVDVKNNVFASTGGPAYSVTAPAAISSSDYNDLYTTGSVLASWGGTSYGTLTALQSGTTVDPHSVSANPEYLSFRDLHTHLAALDGAGTPLAAVPRDIDADARSATAPDLGADEFLVTDTPLPLRTSRLDPIHPNPFNPGVQISFETSTPGLVRVMIFDGRGAEVRRLVSRFLPAGPHAVTWDGARIGGQPASSGIYFVRLETPLSIATRKATLVR